LLFLTFLAYFFSLTWPDCGGINLVCGICGKLLPHSVQQRACGSFGLLAKHDTHLFKILIQLLLAFIKQFF